MATTKRKVGDTNPMVASLADANDRPLLLIGATVTHSVTPLTPGVEAGFDGRGCTVIDADHGKVATEILEDDFVRGVYRMSWTIVWTDGSEETAPTEGWEDLIVEGRA